MAALGLTTLGEAAEEAINGPQPAAAMGGQMRRRQEAQHPLGHENVARADATCDSVMYDACELRHGSSLAFPCGAEAATMPEAGTERLLRRHGTCPAGSDTVSRGRHPGRGIGKSFD